MKQKIVLMPFTRASGGGSFTGAALLAYGLQKIGYRVISVFPEDGNITSLFRQYNINVTILDSPVIESFVDPLYLVKSNMSLIAKAKDFLSSNKVDIIHCNDNSSIFPWGLAAKICNKPCIWHLRTADKGKLDFFRFQVTDLPICMSKFVATRLPGNIPKVLIYDPIDHFRFNPCLNKAARRQSIGIDEYTHVLIQVGRDAAYKRPEWSILALNALLKDGVNASLIFLGDFSLSRQKQLLQLLDSELLSAASRVKFITWVTDPEFYIGAADILLHPAYNESFGRIFIEAAACGVPVIATRSGGAPEVVIDKGTGYLSNPTDLADFSAKTLAILADHDLLKQMSLNAIARSKEFSIESHAQQVSNAYEKYLNLHTPGKL
jgi:glycosyltransferase involved in cell wall biosynthesis